VSDDQDDVLLGELAGLMARVDSVPDDARAAAKVGIAWRGLHARIAEITHDSLLDDTRAMVRSSAAAERLLTFEAPGISVEIEVVVTGGTRRIVGQLVPRQPATVTVRHRGGESAVEVDGLGRFAVGGIAPGPVSLRCRFPAQPDAEELLTAWVPI
jgi:hypothetical protein